MFIYLSGLDVARKVIILARECGLRVEMSDLSIESLVPPALAGLPSGDEYMARLPEVRPLIFLLYFVVPGV